MSFILQKLCTKQEVDEVIRKTEDIVLVLRFGREDDSTCMQIDHVVMIIFLSTYIAMNANVDLICIRSIRPQISPAPSRFGPTR
jgi:hypothetical protein